MSRGAHRSALVVVGLALASQAAAQERVDCPSFPCGAVFANWTAPTAAPDFNRIDGYRVTLDGTVVAEGKPNTATSAGPFEIPTAGTHALSVVSFNASEQSAPVTISVETGPPSPPPPPTPGPLPPPTNLQIRRLATAQAPFQMNGHLWQLAPDAAGQLQIFVDGQHASDAGPGCSELVPVPSQLTVAALCDGSWWQWSETASPHWTNVGPQRPQ